jgi:peroxiredoxin
MRKIIISVIVIGLFSIIFVVVNKAIKIEQAVTEKTDITKTGSDKLPLFEFFTLNAVPYSKYNLEKNQSLIIVYYDPDCSLCEKSGEIFSTFKKLHASSQVLFVSHNSKEKIEDYC